MPSKKSKQLFTRNLVSGWTWTALTTTPEWAVAPEHTVVFPSRATFLAILETIPFKFSPGLLEVLTSPKPPNLRFFKRLPFTKEKV
jgi:hypothetical protein